MQNLIGQFYDNKIRRSFGANRQQTIKRLAFGPEAKPIGNYGQSDRCRSSTP